MNNASILAEILGITFSIFGLSMIVNKRDMAAMIKELIVSKSSMWLAGFVALLLGATILTLNNVWGFGLQLLVTVLGWAIVIKGAFILVFPNATVSYYKKMEKGNIFIWGGVFVLILGIILLLS